MNRLKVLYTDGSGVTLNSQGKRLEKWANYSVYLSDTCEMFVYSKRFRGANESEMKGVKRAIEIAIERKYTNIMILTDSKIVIKHFLMRDMNLNTSCVNLKNRMKEDKRFKYKGCKKVQYYKLMNELVELAHRINNLTINYIPREFNEAHGGLS